MPAPDDIGLVPPGVPAPAAFVRGARGAITRPPEGIDPWFHQYLGHLVDDTGLRTYVRAKRQLLDLTSGVAGKVVVDAGAGFGMVSNLFALWGAKRVISLEVHTPMVHTHARINAAHFPELVQRVHNVRCDVAAMPVKSASADMVFSIEAISHYFNVDGFLDECARVLRPGGQLVVSDGNNGANPAVRKFLLDYWERLENGPEGPFGTEVVPEPMRMRRERVLHQNFPELTAARVDELARVTSGMDRAQIVEVVGAHLRGGPAPATPYARGMCPRDPEWGYVMERQFDARELAARLERRGFTAKAIPHFGGAANDFLLAANVVLRAFPTHRWARAFRVVATKR
jgi:SAM-dependent methyltransferase